eukprot:TRINITY_DN455_c0_g1_i1.p1 TRINITY_DN455_c0_g1~~TRINITY_DN455_c0_g1_i1.p1  ORF type:complete len:140 (-),score=24.56 TRINITY_DN455_c0_g1_i1:25-444(-)
MATPTEDNRHTVVEHLAQLFNNQQLAIQIEDEMFKGFQGHSREYKQQFRHLDYNLKQNQQLFQRVLNGSISPQQIATMSVLDMATPELKEERAEIEHQRLDEVDTSQEQAQLDKTRYIGGQWIPVSVLPPAAERWEQIH